MPLEPAGADPKYQLLGSLKWPSLSGLGLDMQLLSIIELYNLKDICRMLMLLGLKFVNKSLSNPIEARNLSSQAFFANI